MASGILTNVSNAELIAYFLITATPIFLIAMWFIKTNKIINNQEKTNELLRKIVPPDAINEVRIAEPGKSLNDSFSK